ncbi:MAG: hypothetical protein ACKVTZ_05460 [Bacteroidia bacterium]
MMNALSISGTIYTIVGTVKNVADNVGVPDVTVSVYDKDLLGKDDFLGICVTDATGTFRLSFDASKFRFLAIFDRKPDLYFRIEDGGFGLLNTKNDIIRNADESTPPLNFVVDLSNDKLRKLINPTPAAGWEGGFLKLHPECDYPTPDLSSLPVLKNMDNIPKITRQQKVVWPEFSWESELGNPESRCYQMFAPDISRLGYTDDGRVYSIICPQQGTSSPLFGAMNVEVTVTGNRGWANEKNKELAADMSVEGTIWFSPAARKKEHINLIANHFANKGWPFPFTKATAIKINTYNPKKPTEVLFPLTKGASSDFPIPDFAKHDAAAWSLGHLGVLIGGIQTSHNEVVDEFNQLVLDIFNIAAGNMLKQGNTLTWNVWFTAPELVDQQEWQDHAVLWRDSIDIDNSSPEGPGTIARHFDGTPFKPLKEALVGEIPRIVAFIEKHLSKKDGESYLVK